YGGFGQGGPAVPSAKIACQRSIENLLFGRTLLESGCPDVLCHCRCYRPDSVENVERNTAWVDNNAECIWFGRITLAGNGIEVERVLYTSNGEIVLQVFRIQGQTVLTVHIVDPARSQIALDADLHAVSGMPQVVDPGTSLDGAAANEKERFPWDHV